MEHPHSTTAQRKYIDRDLFLGISNKDLWQKKKATKRSNRKVRKVAWNNRIGQSIEERPEHVNQREEFGHWEIDLVVGRQGTKPVIMTLVERKTRKSLYVLIKVETLFSLIFQASIFVCY